MFGPAAAVPATAIDRGPVMTRERRHLFIHDFKMLNRTKLVLGLDLQALLIRNDKTLGIDMCLVARHMQADKRVIASQTFSKQVHVDMIQLVVGDVQVHQSGVAGQGFS